MTADPLRRAAEKLRAIATAATPGPWWSDESDQCWRLHGVARRIPAQLDGLIPEQVMNHQILKAPKHGTPYAEYWPGPADAELITTMGPLVALALADLLVSEAEAWEIYGTPQKHIVAVARAVLREEGPESDVAMAEQMLPVAVETWPDYQPDQGEPR